jgi:hypothetical protein
MVNETTEYGNSVGDDMLGCICWSLKDVGAYLDGDIFDVTISGDRISTSYSVEFFDIVIESPKVDDFDLV